VPVVVCPLAADKSLARPKSVILKVERANSRNLLFVADFPAQLILAGVACLGWLGGRFPIQ
jgi:hypothetical protein